MSAPKTNPDPTPNAAPVFDLADLDTGKASDEGTEIELVHPLNGQPLGIFWGVIGKHSQVFRELMKERVNLRLRREHMARKRGKDPEVMTAEQVEEDAIELLVACSTGWRTGDSKAIRFEGADIEFSVVNAKSVLNKMLWVREQVDNGIGDLENFMKN